MEAFTLVVVCFVVSLVAGFVGGMYGYRYDCARVMAADKKQLDKIESELMQSVTDEELNDALNNDSKTD